MVLAKLATLLAHRAHFEIEGVHLDIRVGERKARLVRIGGAILGPLRHKRSLRILGRGVPVDRAKLVKFFQRGAKVAAVHVIESLLIETGGAPYEMKFGSTMPLLQHVGHTATLDAAKLARADSENDFRASGIGPLHHLSQMRARNHRRFVDHQHGAAIPRPPVAALLAHQFRQNCRGAAETFLAHALHHVVLP